MAYLTGYFENFVDEKGRVIMPKKLKELMGKDLVVTRGLEDCVWVLTPEAWLDLQKKMSQMPISSGRVISTFFNTHQADVTADKQGRVQIPIDLRRIAAIEGNAVVIGNGNRVEIWNPDRFAEMEARTMNIETITAAMDQIGF